MSARRRGIRTSHAVRRSEDMRVITLLSCMVTFGLVIGPGAVSGSQEVVVYSARSSQYGSELVFDAFTKKTGIQVKTFGGNTSELFERLKAEGDKTPADA